MPWSTVKNLVLMVVVIVIVVVILLEIPSLAGNIFDWFSKLFGSTVKTEGKALHVRLDSRNAWLDPFELYEFQLTDLEETQHIVVPGEGAFYLDTSSELYASNCVILTSLEGETLEPDWAFIYYMSPGSRVQEGCDNLEGCVNVVEKNCSVAYNYFDGGKVGSDDCYCYCTYEMCEAQDINGAYPDCPNHCWPGGAFVTDLSCENPFGYVVASSTAYCPIYDSKSDPLRQCDFSESVFRKEFATVKDTKDKCEDSSSCELLVTEEGKHAYMVKYGLICDSSGTWKACTEQREKDGDNVQLPDGAIVTCQQGSGTDFFVWQ